MRIDFNHFEKSHDFIEAVALDCIKEMSDEDKDSMLQNPDAGCYHFGYGLWIRNIYIYPNQLHFPVFMADILSNSIIIRIITLLQQGVLTK